MVKYQQKEAEMLPYMGNGNVVQRRVEQAFGVQAIVRWIILPRALANAVLTEEVGTLQRFRYLALLESGTCESAT